MDDDKKAAGQSLAALLLFAGLVAHLKKRGIMAAGEIQEIIDFSQMALEVQWFDSPHVPASHAALEEVRTFLRQALP